MGEAPDQGGYPPIAEHGVIGDLRTVALVATDGAIDWYCCPTFDSPSVFASILDSERGGHYRIAPQGPNTSRQMYFPDTNVLLTRFLTPEGVCHVEDFMPVVGQPSEDQTLVRRIVGIRGNVPMRIEVEPRFDYGRADHKVERAQDHTVFKSDDLSLTLSGTVALEPTERGAGLDLEVREGDMVALLLQTGDRPHLHHGAETLFRSTVDFWHRWLAGSSYRGRWREMLERSALTLKLLTYQPTGAIVAAPTTSLPEQVGGERNWDYRYTWIRDAAFTTDAFLRLGLTEEAEGFGRFVRERVLEVGRSQGGPPQGQIMFGIDGRRELTEEILPHLEGYRGSSPVRIGNGAATQLQLDIFGEAMDAFYLLTLTGRPPFVQGWEVIRRILDLLCDHWDQPDEGIWETRGGRKRFTYSRLMCWVALDRGIRIARQDSLPGDLTKWMAARDAIFQRVHTKSWHEGRGAFVQHEDTEVLDASVLLMPLVGFISPIDPRWLSTLDAITNELVSDSLVYRYNPEASPDGLAGAEGTFSICTFWYVSALAKAGRVAEARLVFDKMLTHANHLGLFAEEIGPTGEQLGNFPQAFTHLSLIRAAIDLDEQLGD